MADVEETARQLADIEATINAPLEAMPSYSVIAMAALVMVGILAKVTGQRRRIQATHQ
jgi:hypothetical protein